MSATNPYVAYLGKGKVQQFRQMRLCPAVSARMTQDQINNTRIFSYSVSRPNVLVSGIYQPLQPEADGSYWFNLKAVPKPSEFLLMIDTDGSGYTVTRGGLTKKLAPIQDRHSGGMNALFGDYHVEWISYSKIVQQVAIPAWKNTWFQGD